MFENYLSELARQVVVDIIKNPNSLASLATLLSDFGCHTASDVATDALDAYKAGNLSADQAMRIVAICIQNERTASVDRPTVSGGRLLDADLIALSERIKNQMM